MMDTNDEFDVGEGEASASPDTLKLLEAAMSEAIELESARLQMEEDLSALTKTLTGIKTKRIPELMDQLQMESCNFRGWKVAISTVVSGSLPPDPEARQRAIHWLEENDGGGLIKTKVALDFGRSEHNQALALAAQLEEQGFTPKVDSGVHASTLCAFARERLRNGDPIDTDVLGLYTGKAAKFTPPKEKK
jgi:hypothetical protein